MLQLNNTKSIQRGIQVCGPILNQHLHSLLDWSFSAEFGSFIPTGKHGI